MTISNIEVSVESGAVLMTIGEMQANGMYDEITSGVRPVAYTRPDRYEVRFMYHDERGNVEPRRFFGNTPPPDISPLPDDDAFIELYAWCSEGY